MPNTTSPGKKLRQAVEQNNPLQVVGTVNAYSAIMAEKCGHKAIYLSGGGVAACSLGTPDLGITTLKDVLEDAFDFGFDWEVLHHVFPEKREAFVDNVFRMLRPGALHLSVCFSEQNTSFGGVGKYRETPLGTKLYFSSEEEVEQIYSPKFQILELATRQVEGKYGPHIAVVALLERKS